MSLLVAFALNGTKHEHRSSMRAKDWMLQDCRHDSCESCPLGTTSRELNKEDYMRCIHLYMQQDTKMKPSRCIPFVNFPDWARQTQRTEALPSNQPPLIIAATILYSEAWAHLAVAVSILSSKAQCKHASCWVCFRFIGQSIVLVSTREQKGTSTCTCSCS